jgi:hypothetical protein
MKLSYKLHGLNSFPRDIFMKNACEIIKTKFKKLFFIFSIDKEGTQK